MFFLSAFCCRLAVQAVVSLFMYSSIGLAQNIIDHCFGPCLAEMLDCQTQSEKPVEQQPAVALPPTVQPKPGTTVCVRLCFDYGCLINF